jgi:hypothetical protein
MTEPVDSGLVLTKDQTIRLNILLSPEVVVEAEIILVAVAALVGIYLDRIRQFLHQGTQLL